MDKRGFSKPKGLKREKGHTPTSEKRNTKKKQKRKERCAD